MTQKIIVAGGCFWGIQAFFDQIKGIIKSEVGYMHGNSKNPTYEQVCTSSGHVEVVVLDFDETKITLKRILECFWEIIDPYSLNKQGADQGIQYRTGLYYYNSNQKIIIKQFLEEKQKNTPKKIMVEVKKVCDFFPGEKYHQKYLAKNPGGYCHIDIEKSLVKLNLK